MKQPDVEIVRQDGLKLDELTMAILRELSKPRNESIDMIVKLTGTKRPLVQTALDNLVKRKFVRKAKSNQYEVINNVITNQDKFDSTEKDIFNLLLTPNILSASTLMKRSSVVYHIEQIGEVEKVEPDNNVAIQLVLKRLDHLLKYKVVQRIAVNDKRIRFKYALTETPACITTPKGMIFMIPLKYADDKKVERLSPLFLGCQYTETCERHRTGKGDCRLYDEIMRR
jgi:hypothetical protein